MSPAVTTDFKAVKPKNVVARPLGCALEGGSGTAMCARKGTLGCVHPKCDLPQSEEVKP